jgi:hypothetical protein
MQEIIKTLRTVIETLEVSDLSQRREIMLKDLEIERLTRGNQSLQEVIKDKDSLISLHKESVEFYRPKPEKKG